MLRGMVPYADFYTTVATLAPIFWLIGLVGVYRLGSHPVFRTKRGFAPGGPFLIAILSAVMVTNEAISLVTLGGWWFPDRSFRLTQIGLLCVQIALGTFGFV